MQVAESIDEYLIAGMDHDRGTGILDDGWAAETHLRLQAGVVVDGRVVDAFEGEIHRALAFVGLCQRATGDGQGLQVQLANLRDGHQMETDNFQRRL